MTRYIETEHFIAKKDSNGWRSWRKDEENGMSIGYANTQKAMRESLERLEKRERALEANEEATLALSARDIEMLKEALIECYFAKSQRHDNTEGLSKEYGRIDRILSSAFQTLMN